MRCAIRTADAGIPIANGATLQMIRANWYATFREKWVNELLGVPATCRIYQPDRQARKTRRGRVWLSPSGKLGASVGTASDMRWNTHGGLVHQVQLRR